MDVLALAVQCVGRVVMERELGQGSVLIEWVVYGPCVPGVGWAASLYVYEAMTWAKDDSVAAVHG